MHVVQYFVLSHLILKQTLPAWSWFSSFKRWGNWRDAPWYTTRLKMFTFHLAGKTRAGGLVIVRFFYIFSTSALLTFGCWGWGLVAGLHLELWGREHCSPVGYSFKRWCINFYRLFSTHPLMNSTWVLNYSLWSKSGESLCLLCPGDRPVDSPATNLFLSFWSSLEGIVR